MTGRRGHLAGRIGQAASRRRAGAARAARLGGIAGVALAVAACSPIVRDHGYVPPEEELAEIAVGLDTRATVEDRLGTPGTSGVQADRGYFYVTQRVQQRGYRAPEVIDREVVAISFDADGVVSNVERFGLEDGNAVALSRRVTDSTVQGAGLLRQLLGNVGQLDASALGGGSGADAGPGGVLGP